MSRKITKEEFIKRAREKFGNKYDYSKIDYVDINTEVEIICPIHGKFKQKPHNHLRKGSYGCPECANIEHDNKCEAQRLSNEEFIRRAKLKHGDKYEYSATHYVSRSNIIEVLCPKHGTFQTHPHDFLCGCGCQKCAAEKKHEIRKTTEQFMISMRENPLL